MEGNLDRAIFNITEGPLTKTLTIDSNMGKTKTKMMMTVTPS